jgi:hypothetical protein
MGQHLMVPVNVSSVDFWRAVPQIEKSVHRRRACQKRLEDYPQNERDSDCLHDSALIRVPCANHRWKGVKDTAPQSMSKQW